MRLLISSQILNVMVKIDKEQQIHKNGESNLSRINNLPVHLHPKCDSLQLFIRFDKCKLIDKRFTAEYIKVYNIPNSKGEDQYFKELETEKQNRQNSLYIEAAGVSVKFQYAMLMMEGKAVGQQAYCLITINSKQLQEQYFKGITEDTIKDLYDFIISAGVVEFSYNTFINSRVADIDICLDILNFQPSQHRELLNLLKQKVSLKYTSYVNYKGKNKGTLQYYNRKDAKNSAKLPYLKFYDKSEELTGHSNEFYSAFIDHQEDVKRSVYKGITRIEYTLAGQQQLKAYNLTIKTLKDVLSTPAEEYIRVLISILDEYNGNNIRTMAKEAKLSLTDSLILSLLGGLIESGWSSDRIIDLATGTGNHASDSSKNKKRLKELLKYIDNKDILEQNNAKQKGVNDVLKFLEVYKD